MSVTMLVDVRELIEKNEEQEGSKDGTLRKEEKEDLT